jgi:hypothetical protein
MDNPEDDKKSAEHSSEQKNAAIQGVQQKLDSIIAQLENSRDPRKRHSLLIQMRILMAELDSLVFDPSRLQPRRSLAK